MKPDTENIAANRPGILLVDDEPHVLAALRRTLGREPYTVYVAESGDQGLKLLEEHPDIAVVISDYRMPGMDGVEFLQRVKRYSPDIQRVMLTGHADSKAVERAVNESEIHRFLNKPWNTAQLLAMVRECLEHRLLLEENRQYERELAERNRQLEALNRDLERKVDERTRALLQAEKMAALGRMAGGVAHEINNPLGGILIYASLLMEEIPPEDPKRADLERIVQEATRCKEIVKSLLEFARQSSPEMEPTDVNRAITDGLLFLENQATFHNIEIVKELDPSLPPVFGNAGQLKQVFMNIMINAADAMHGHGTLTIRTHPSQDGREVVIEFTDTGEGIPEEVLPRIFDPFFTTKEVGKGTGLGLSMSYGIVKEHGGRIEVETEVGKGTTFRVMLPVTLQEG